MAMNFRPRSEEEVKMAGLLPKGDYDFEVLFAKDSVSKSSNNPMIELKLGVFRPDGTQAHVFDYLVPSMEAKLRHFCDATGLLDRYQLGALKAEDCAGKVGKLKLVIDSKDKNYEPKNAVKDYICRTALPLAGSVGGPPVETVSSPVADDDSIPF